VFPKLQSYEWPGNIRELRNVVERLVIMCDEAIHERDLPTYLGGPRTVRHVAAAGSQIDFSRYSQRNLKEFRDEMEAELIKQRLVEHEWNISAAAKSLQIERTNLHKRMRQLNIHREGAGPAKDEPKDE
jgi:two-component system nitrogen regulation response regulator NtrX